MVDLDLGQGLWPADPDALALEQGDEPLLVLQQLVPEPVGGLGPEGDEPRAPDGLRLRRLVLREEQLERNVVGIVEVERRADDDLLERVPVVVGIHYGERRHDHASTALEPRSTGMRPRCPAPPAAAPASARSAGTSSAGGGCPAISSRRRRAASR